MGAGCHVSAVPMDLSQRKWGAETVKCALVDIKDRQSCKIRKLGEALVAAGYASLDAQAHLLGLSRSTTWTILRGSHKSSGLSARIVHRILSAPKLPARVRAEIFEYIEAKATGLYGHSRSQRQKFVSRLAGEYSAGGKERSSRAWRNLRTRVFQDGCQKRGQEAPLQQSSRGGLAIRLAHWAGRK
jgi:hypothetical protein